MIAWLGRHRTDALRGFAALAAVAVVAVLSRPAPQAGLDTYSASDVRSGGYAAWESLMQREGVAVERFDAHPIELDGTIDTLIDAYALGSAGAERTPADIDALAQWVRRGGRLIMIGSAPQLTGQETKTLGRPAQRRVARSGAPLEASAFGGAVATLASTSHTRFVVGRGSHGLVLLADRGGPLVVRVPLGHGAMLFISDPRLFANNALARADNARLAYLLARPRQRGRIIAFDEALHGSVRSRGWWETLGVPERIAFTGTVLAILLALAGGALRLGPAIALRAVREPPADEFIAAVAALYARSRARGAAIALLAGDVTGTSAASMQLRALRERSTPSDRDLIESAVLAREQRGERR